MGCTQSDTQVQTNEKKKKKDEIQTLKKQFTKQQKKPFQIHFEDDQFDFQGNSPNKNNLSFSQFDDRKVTTKIHRQKLKNAKKNINLALNRKYQQNPEEQNQQTLQKRKRKKLIDSLGDVPVQNLQFIKPVIYYSPNHRGRILKNDKNKEKPLWELPITEVDQYKSKSIVTGANFTTVDQKSYSPYRKKQIDDRLNDIKMIRDISQPTYKHYLVTINRNGF